MGNTTKLERNIKFTIMREKFEELKEISDNSNINHATLVNVVKEANNDPRVKVFKNDIGDKSLYNIKKPESEGYKLLQEIRDYEETHKQQVSSANKKVKSKLKNMDVMLVSHEKAAISLQESIHVLQKRLANKEAYIQQLEQERDNCLHQISQIKNGIDHAY